MRFVSCDYPPKEIFHPRALYRTWREAATINGGLWIIPRATNSTRLQRNHLTRNAFTPAPVGPPRPACRLAGGLPHPPLKKAGKLANSKFFRTQLSSPVLLAPPTEFANPDKLTGKLANSFSARRPNLTWSDRESARHCQVSQVFVSKLRKEASASDNGYQMKPRGRFCGRATQTKNRRAGEIRRGGGGWR
jgi:hypothetical protein